MKREKEETKPFPNDAVFTALLLCLFLRHIHAIVPVAAALNSMFAASK